MMPTPSYLDRLCRRDERSGATARERQGLRRAPGIAAPQSRLAMAEEVEADGSWHDRLGKAAT
jgi:hypothetical protein